MKRIPLAPMGKPRPRVTRNGTFMPPRYESWRLAVRALHGQVDIDGPLSLRLIAVRPMPKSWSHRKRRMMDGGWCCTTPDADNIAGAVMDALLEDDSRVVRVEVSKIWGDEAAMMVDIREADIPPSEDDA